MPENRERPNGYDPSKNVEDNIAAAVKRLDDLREKSDECLMAEVDHVKEDLVKLEIHLKEMLLSMEKTLAQTRQVDILNQQAARTSSELAVQTLQKSQEIDKETLRKQVAEVTVETGKRIGAVELAIQGIVGRGAGIGMAWGVIIAVLGLLGGGGIVAMMIKAMAK